MQTARRIRRGAAADLGICVKVKVVVRRALCSKFAAAWLRFKHAARVARRLRHAKEEASSYVGQCGCVPPPLTSWKH